MTMRRGPRGRSETGAATVILAVFALIAVLGTATDVRAHKVTVFAWYDGDKVHIESKFGGGRRVNGGKVEVFAPDGTLLLEGRTDAEGELAFKPPQITDLSIVLTAGTGHRGEWTLTAAELGDSDTAAPPDESTPAAVATPTASSSAQTAGVTASEIEAIVSRQLDKRIAPLARMIAESRETGTRVQDIVGGLGYILGLVGLGAYLRYRRDGRRP